MDEVVIGDGDDRGAERETTMKQIDLPHSHCLHSKLNTLLSKHTPRLFFFVFVLYTDTYSKDKGGKKYAACKSCSCGTYIQYMHAQMMEDEIDERVLSDVGKKKKRRKKKDS